METKEVVSISPVSVTADGDNFAVRVALADRIRWIEWLLVPLVLVALIAAQLRFAGGAYLFHREFWADELHTFWVVDDPDFIHSMRALRHGADGGPPVFYGMLRGFSWAAGGANETTFRLYSFVCVLVALAGVYVLIRSAGFSALAAMVAIWTIWCGYQFQKYAFEARFYAPWLAALSWFCVFWARARANPSSLVNTLLVGLLAFIAATTHYFGAVSVALVVGADLLLNRGGPKLPWRTWAAVALAPMAMIGCYVVFARGQQAALSIPTWNEPFSWEDEVNYLKQALLLEQLPAVLLIAWLAWLVGPRSIQAETHFTSGIASLGGITGLLAMPLFVVAFSRWVQPATEFRYTIPVLLAFAPVIAFAIGRAHWLWNLALIVGLWGYGAVNLRFVAHEYKFADEKSAAMIDAVRKHTGDAPVYFESYHELWLVRRYAPELQDRCFALDFEENEINDVNKARIVMRDYERAHQKYYHPSKLMKWSALKKQKDFFLVPGYFTADKDAVHLTDDSYPGFAPQPVDARLYAMVARPAEAGR